MSVDVYINGDDIDCLFGDQGPTGRNAVAGLEFVFSGTLQTNEPPQAAYWPTGATFSAASSGGDWDTPPTGTTSWLIYAKPRGGAFGLFAAATVSPAGVSWAFTQAATTGPTYFKCDPPATPDPTLSGLSLFMGGP